MYVIHPRPPLNYYNIQILTIAAILYLYIIIIILCAHN